LLTNNNRNGLYYEDARGLVEVIFVRDGSIKICHVKNKRTLAEESLSLRSVGTKVLNLRDPSVETMLRYLVTPELEVERIFNTLRYKYLQCIYDSPKIKNPTERINSDCNKAFQALAGFPVYQGGAQPRCRNDSFWQSAGFDSRARRSASFENEHLAMRVIIDYIRGHYRCDMTRLYMELISIKPGFHERREHDDFWDEKPKDGKSISTKRRASVLNYLRGQGKVSNVDRVVTLIDAKDVNNSSKYLTYASCSITEGPFVYRKRLEVRYAPSIRQSRKIDLSGVFFVLRYKDAGLTTKEQLGSFLEKAARFKAFPNKMN
jgi:hypothetical protein